MIITADTVAKHFTCDVQSAALITNVLNHSSNVRFVMPGIVTFEEGNTKCALSYSDYWQLTKISTRISDNIHDLI